MNLLSYVKRSFRQRHMKKVHFKVLLSLEELSSVPYINGVFFTKIHMSDSLKSIYSEHALVEDHKVKWFTEHTFMCKSAVDPLTNTLRNSFLKISIMKEAEGGKSAKVMGYVVINLAPFASTGNQACRRLYIMADGHLRQSNCLLQLSIKMCQIFGDPCFRVPSEDLSNCVNQKMPTDRCSTHNVAAQCNTEFSFVVTQDEDEVEDEDSTDVVETVRACGSGGSGSADSKTQRPLTQTNSPIIGPMTSYPELDPVLLTIRADSVKGHRRNASAIDGATSSNNVLGGAWSQNQQPCRKSGPNFMDDMAPALVFQQRICRSTMHFQYEETPRVTSFMDPTAMMYLSANMHTTKQDLIHSTRGSRADIVDDILQQVLATEPKATKNERR